MKKVLLFFNLNEPGNLQTVEVLRGPNAAQYGFDSLGGTINFRSKRLFMGGTEDEFHGEVSSYRETWLL